MGNNADWTPLFTFCAYALPKRHNPIRDQFDCFVLSPLCDRMIDDRGQSQYSTCEKRSLARAFQWAGIEALYSMGTEKMAKRFSFRFTLSRKLRSRRYVIAYVFASPIWRCMAG
jgi:hypothetical protein